MCSTENSKQEEILQLTLTPRESKEMIARGLMEYEPFKRAKKQGKILLKGGSTVSAAAQQLCNKPLKVCGMILPSGAKMNVKEGLPHVLLYDQGTCRSMDDDEAFFAGCKELKKQDLVICGANAVDAYGNAAMMTGSPQGGGVPAALAEWNSEGIPVIVLVGLEKLVPGNLSEIIKRTGRQKKALSFGMAVGLTPVNGEIFTEKKAIEALAQVKVTVIGAGGIAGAEGSITLDVQGSREEIEKIFSIAKMIKCSTIDKTDMIQECEAKSEHCRSHLACIYKRRGR